MEQLMPPVAISPSAIVPMNNFSSGNQTRDLGSDTNFWIEHLPLGKKL